MDAMLRELTAKQLLEWRAYDELDPFGEERDDYRAASIREMVFNMSGKESKNARPMKDFLIPWEPESPEEAKERQQKELEARVAMHRRLIPVLAMACSTQVKEM